MNIVMAFVCPNKRYVTLCLVACRPTEHNNAMHPVYQPILSLRAYIGMRQMARQLQKYYNHKSSS